jgi:soluble lytic murein transglycosylase-like protein
VNVHLGCQVLKRLLAWGGKDVRKALGAYNAGRGGWDSPVGQAYAKKVLDHVTRVKAGRGGNSDGRTT